jgi:hypothetical protein
MNETAVIYKDLGREPRVRPRGANSKTHVVTQIPPQFVMTLAPELEALLAPAVVRSRGRWTMEALMNDLANGNQQLWGAYTPEFALDGVMTTRVVTYPARRMLAMDFLGGKNFNDWVYGMLDIMYSFARDYQCDGIEGTARHGFWKWLEPEGFERAYTVYEKRIDHV